MIDKGISFIDSQIIAIRECGPLAHFVSWPRLAERGVHHAAVQDVTFPTVNSRNANGVREYNVV
jgi:hypothetical protein